MDDQESQNSQVPKTHRPRTWLIILLSFLFLLLVSFVGLFLSFNYFGEQVLRKYLQAKVFISSGGLYQVDFKKLNVNILTGKVVLDSFELNPDKFQYERLKEKGKVARALYRISFTSLTIDKVHFRQIYAGKRINFRQLTVQSPLISIEDFPDTMAAKRNKWKVIYEDLYPAVSGFFNDFHIDSVKVNHGRLLTTSLQKKGRQTSGEYEFSSVLRDVSVNPYSYYNRERVFYSRDIDLVVHNFEYHLADSLYSIKAEEVGFSLTKSTLYGKKVSLSPNFKSKRIRHLRNGDLFRIDLPELKIQGIDLYRAMTYRKVEVSVVTLTDFIMRMYRNHPPEGATIGKKTKKKITLAGLYTVVAKELRFIAIDSLSLKNGSFEFYGNISDSKPEMKIGTVDLELSQFRLDSLSHKDQSRIFYSRAIELDLEKFYLQLRDGIHYIEASSISFSTRKSLIKVREARISPGKTRNLLDSVNRRNLMTVHLPQLSFTGIDLKKVFNRRVLDFNKLIINEPEIMYTRLKPPKNPDPRFKKPEDFFEEENEEVVYDLLKKYLWVVKGQEIAITHGFLKFSVEQNGQEIPLASSSFDLIMQQFLIDSVHGMNRQGYFYSSDFDLDLQSVLIVSPDNLKQLQAERVRIVTKDSLIEVNNISIVKGASPLAKISHRNRRQSLNFEFSLQKLHLTGLNHKKLFLEKTLRANKIIFEHPSLTMKTSDNEIQEGPITETQLLKTNKFIKSFEIGQCLVKKGAFTYNGEADRNASSFSLKDIDFEVIAAVVQLPQKGIHVGSIKFDSINLNVFPLRAVIADGAYDLEASSLKVNSYPANIILKGIKVTRIISPNEKPGSISLLNLSVPEIRLNGFYFDRAIFDNKWQLDALSINHPSAELIMNRVAGQSGTSRRLDPESLIRIPRFMKTILLGNASIEGADILLNIKQPDQTRIYRLKEAILRVTNFKVDSCTHLKLDSARLFNADDISFSAPGYSWVSSDSMYTYAFNRFGFSTGSASAFLDSVSITPNYSKNDFSQKLGWQTDRIVLQVPGIKISHLDFRKLISERQLFAAKINLDGLNFQSYRDKRLPFPSWQRPLMPGKMVDRISFPLSVDTVTLSNGYASYEEQTGDEPGRIFFDQMTATITGLSTPSAKSRAEDRRKDLDLHGTTRLMGLAPAEAWFHFQAGSPSDSFEFFATVGELYLPAINPMLSKLVPASITLGTANSTEIIRINADSSKATGSMTFRYNDFAIRLHPTKAGTWHLIEQSLLTELVNLLLANSNPNDAGKLKTGVIYFERDPSKGFFNFIWKSILSGLKSTMGLNSREQKEMKKMEKQKLAEKEKKEKKQKK